ncbi:MAG TPA: hydantoinase B/oxoprolinase family protein [Prosthecobacter sp.]|nr:hydantoinase B/oxoprolinase family protein [Prosthecobacter sp.]
MWRIAADTGGTFTDAYAIDPTGRESRCKVLSTARLRVRIEETISPSQWRVSGLPVLPRNFYVGFTALPVALPSGSFKVTAWDSVEGVLEFEPATDADLKSTLLDLSTTEEAPILATRLLTGTALGAAFPPLELRLATTRATNALLEHKGSPTALLITRGFGDLLRIGDQRRKDLFALQHQPRPIFFTDMAEVLERVAADGSVLSPLDEAGVKAIAADLLGRGIRHAAVALLHSHLFPAHERRVGELLLQQGFEHVSLSSEIAPFTKILPRAQSALANAYLTGPVDAFVGAIAASLQHQATLQVMTSAGGLEAATEVKPKDLLLSGPAGGAIGAANAAAGLGHRHILTLDMGGTSTDVARIDGRPGYRFSQNVAGMQLLAPCVAIETVAAGGGSICRWTHHGLAVGPESAGSDPGPACYGKGGPLTITDVNVLLGRFDPARAPIPLDLDASRRRLRELHAACGGAMTETALLQGCLRLAVEHMADAIRRISVAEGYDPADYALLAFGGAGPQHACAVAERLGIRTILAPLNAGILSAVGLHQALPEKFAEQQILQLLSDCSATIPDVLAVLTEKARTALRTSHGTVDYQDPVFLAEVRLRGQDTPIQVAFTDAEALPDLFRSAYLRLFGYPPPAHRGIELVSLRVSVHERAPAHSAPAAPAPKELGRGPLLIQDAFSTLVVEQAWQAREIPGFGHVLSRTESAATDAPVIDSPFARDLVRHRFHSMVEEMGSLLCRTAISTNIRERLDFSCALLDPQGRLISSAPHIPVHLGALGVCVREAVKGFDLKRGDTLITNHPAFGGSHLPDVTLITPVFDDEGLLLGFVANRAHHAEIGGITPGSMPATATRLIEEGVVISPQYLVCAGEARFESISHLLTSSRYPTRNLADNLADLHAQLAANLQGAERLRALAGGDPDRLRALMAQILDHSASVMRGQISRMPAETTAEQTLDDGARINVKVHAANERLILDFAGSSPAHPGNLNATRAIVRSAVLYVLRLLLQEDLPLNEGLLQPVEIRLPESLLNPPFTGDPAQDPAVVGGNVEVSQRLVDTLIQAFDLQACSQGTMNNFLFGSGGFGYYETIAGGAGAGPGYAGADALHTHMTNTAITDPEVIEQRYPVRLREFSIRRGSGGAGTWPGGDGVVREFEFLAPLTVSLLTQHRREGPFGLHGGASGATGKQTLIRDGHSSLLPSSASFEAVSGDRVRIETPGGGGWGAV